MFMDKDGTLSGKIITALISTSLIACASDIQSDTASPAHEPHSAVSLTDFTHLGYFSPPKGSDFGNGLLGMTYDPTCTGLTDPSPDDGLPGCIVTQARANKNLTAVIDIVKDGRSSVVRKPFDATGGLHQKNKLDTRNRVSDIVMLDSHTAMTVCLQDWYNTARIDHPTHCLSSINADNKVTARGPYNFSDIHALSVGGYVGKIPQAWSKTYLGSGDWCFTGFKRKGSGITPFGSAGPSQFAFRCDSKSLDTLKDDGDISGAITLMKYDHEKPLNSFGINDIKDWTLGDDCMDAVWLDESTFAVSCIRGGQYWWYGNSNPWKRGARNHRNGYGWINPDNPKPNKEKFLQYGPAIPEGLDDVCTPYKGYHAIDENGHRSLELWLFPGNQLGEVAKGTRTANSIQPIRITPPGLLSPVGCNRIGGLAWDDKNRLLFMVEKQKSKSFIHIYRIAGPAS